MFVDYSIGYVFWTTKVPATQPQICRLKTDFRNVQSYHPQRENASKNFQFVCVIQFVTLSSPFVGGHKSLSQEGIKAELPGLVYFKIGCSFLFLAFSG